MKLLFLVHSFKIRIGSYHSEYLIYLTLLGNQTSNKNLKAQQKKAKKSNKRNEKKVNAVANVLENFTLDMSGGDQDYSFEADFN